MTTNSRTTRKKKGRTEALLALEFRNPPALLGLDVDDVLEDFAFNEIPTT